MKPPATYPREKSYPVFRAVSAGLYMYGGCMGPLVPILKTKSLYTLDKMQYFTWEQRLYPISAAAVSAPNARLGFYGTDY